MQARRFLFTSTMTSVISSNLNFNYSCQKTNTMFIDRKDAAQKLALALSAYRDQNAIVLGIPRGGVEIAYYVALYLHAELSLVITRKLGYQDNPEAAFGAVAEDGSLYLSPGATNVVSQDEIDEVAEMERKEIQRRIKKLRKGKSIPEMRGRTVIIVDDGIATGATLLAAIAMCKKRHPLKIVVAAPIASQRIENELETLVNDVIILEKPIYYYAVGQGYRHFYNLSDEDTIAFLDLWDNRLKTAS
jgi:putative phosphoribosyl transferase